ncbi:tetratricopeptide repeat protein [Marinifilum sp. RC60d5]|uniref:tetratricopeptide repeat protein n=1 Tax=Marinifilum sp. RC60d5 TaxID=3458414 RepID=UPI00403588EA
MKGFLTAVLLLVSFFVSAQDFDAFLNKANSKFFDKNYQEALKEYQALLEKEIGDSIQRSWAFGYVGVCKQELGKIEEAKKSYLKAMEMGTPGPSFYQKCLAIYKSEKDVKGQEFVLLAKKKNMPHEYRKTVKSLVYLYVNSKQFKKLLPLCDELLEWYPNNYKYRYFKGVSYQKLNEIEKAKAEYRKAVSLKSDDVNSNMNLGMIIFLRANKDYDLAVKKYEAIAKPTDDDYQKCKLKLAAARKGMRQAEPYLLEAYNAKPNKNVKNALFNLYRKCNEQSKSKVYQ